MGFLFLLTATLACAAEISLRGADSPKLTARADTGFAPSACSFLLGAAGPRLAFLSTRAAPLSGGRASAVRSKVAVRQSTKNFLITESPLGNHANRCGQPL